MVVQCLHNSQKFHKPEYSGLFTGTWANEEIHKNHAFVTTFLWDMKLKRQRITSLLCGERAYSAMRFAQAVVRSYTTKHGKENFRGFQQIMR